jgi:hypothetical protein
MANRNWEDPYDVAALAKEDGPEGLFRLAQYLEDTAQPIPTALKTGMVMSRGPGVLPIKDFPYNKKAVRSAAETMDDVPESLRPSDWVTARPSKAVDSVPESLRPSDWVTARPAPLKQTTDNNLGVVPVPPPEGVSADLLGPFFRPVNETNLPPEGLRLPVEPGPTLATAAPRVSPSTPMSSDVASPIPVAAAPVKANVPGALKGAIPATTTTRPAPPVAGTSGGVKPPPVEEGAGGDDDVRNLYLARLAAQSAAGFGGMGAGKNIDMGIADTLGERMQQIEALRAKREERSM